MQNIYQLGEKYKFPLLFSSLFNQIFPNMLFGHIFAPPPPENYTPLAYIKCRRM